MTKKDFAIALLRGILRIELRKYQKAQSMPALKRKRKKRAFEESNINMSYIKTKLAQDVAAAAANKAPAAPKAPKPEVASGTGPLATDVASNFNPSWNIASGTMKVPDYNP
jgi:hypothetical protein